MESIINDIIQIINNSDWNVDKKIRYAYLELGKHIHKNVEFFYTLFNKIKNGKYSSDEIKTIYTSNLFTDNVICRDVVLMLKYIFDNCGIESDVRRFCKVQQCVVDGEKIGIQHFIIAVTGDMDKKYFLTLVPDIPNIQLGFRTEHFANNIEYTDEQGNQIYEGEKINHTVMPFEKIKEIDKELGFLSLKLNEDDEYNYMDEVFSIMQKMSAMKITGPLIRTENNLFYMNLVKFLNNFSGNFDNSSLSCDMSKISHNDWNFIIEYIFNNVMVLYSKKYDKSDFNIIYNDIIDSLKKEDYDDFYSKLKQFTNKISDNSPTLFNVKAIEHNLITMIKTINNIKEVEDFKSKEFLDLKRAFNDQINKLGILFINKHSVYVNNKEFSNGYIVNKLKYYMPLIFDFGNDTTFSKMGIGEKVVILDKVLQLLLNELRTDTLMPRNQPEFLDNRTYRTVIKDIETGNYLYMILIHGAGTYGNKVLIYDFEENIIKGFDDNISFVDIMSDDRYEILSDRIYIEVERMEEYRKNSAKKS